MVTDVAVGDGVEIFGARVPIVIRDRSSQGFRSTPFNLALVPSPIAFYGPWLILYIIYNLHINNHRTVTIVC